MKWHPGYPGFILGRGNGHTQTYLEIHRIPSTKTGLDLGDHMLSMSIKDMKVTDPITSKEWTGHGTMKFPHVG